MQDRITEDLLSLGLRRGGTVLVHSSLCSMGYVPEGPKTVIRGLLKALGPAGTLLMPALSLDIDAKEAVFDVLRTPSCVGAIPEYFRTRCGTMRSINPTHSVCGAGSLSEPVLGRHHCDETPCGPNSPYRLLPHYAGQILFLGCGLKPNTSMHSIEEVVEPPYLFGGFTTYRIILPDGRKTHMKCRRHDFAGYTQRYDRIAPLLKNQGLKTGKVLTATAHIVESGLMWDRSLTALKQDTFFFVDSKAPGKNQKVPI